jgi:uncharacterized membrane protein
MESDPTITGAMESTLAPAVEPGARPRLDSVDLLRGLVMVIMALDHTRGFLSNVTFYPLDPDKTWPALFFTRWITHYCAPVFVFLAGTGAFLSTTRGKTKNELAWFLVSRGLWLVLLECTVIRWFGWAYNFDLQSIGTGVIWAIGWSMVGLAGLIYLPVPWIAVFGIVMVAGHNLLDHVDPAPLGSWRWVWEILHRIDPSRPEAMEYLPGYKLVTGYPLIPWIGVMASGYAFGSWLRFAPERRRKWFFALGATLTILFILIRGLNVYGDPYPWSQQKTGLQTLYSFLHCHKYPPSLVYLLMTLGPALMLLSWLDRGVPRWLRPCVVFGRVPLFYYLLHLPLIHGLAVLLSFSKYGKASWLYGSSPAPRPPGYGYDLPVVYLVWIAAVLILYPVCRWFAEVKRRRRDAWLSYL